MSRLVVKNLPKNITEEKLRNLFQEKGTITDVQLKYTPEGKFREFAFVGYQNENEAQEAIKHFDGMFMHTRKIKVEPCALLGDSKKPKAWSKYAPESTAYKKAHGILTKEEDNDKPKVAKKNQKEDETIELLKKYQDDPMFEEFLELHNPEESKKLRKIIEKQKEHDVKSESEEDEGKGSSSENDSDEETQDRLADQKISDLEYMKKLVKKKEKPKKEPKKLDLFTLKLRGLPYNSRKKDIKQFLKPVTPFSIRLPAKIHGIAYVGFKTEKDYKKALLKDRSFIAGKRISVMEYSGKNNTEHEETSNNVRKKWVSQEEALKNEEDIAETGKIFVRNLAYTTTEDDVENLFSKFGPLAEVNLPVDPTSKKIKGFGTVTFVMPEHAARAYGELDGSILHGRMVHLLPGKSKDVADEPDLEESTNFKKKKEAKQKSEAGSSHNWNSLFLGHNAVAEVIADTYSTSKEKVMGLHDDGSAAVRLALGETQIVAQTRKYLEQEGVQLDAFSNNKCKRSKTVILVKNLPNKTEAKEIRTIFEKFGLVGRLILPPSGITAIVEFLEPSEARKAFTCLAYTKFKNVPLYLEWAPENSLGERKEPPVTNEDTTEVKQSENNNEVEETVEESEPDTTLFVKNLNFQTTDDGLRKHFESCGKLAYASVATKKDKNDPSKRLSMGYGFVRFIHKSSADKALKTLQQSTLDGKSLELKRSERTLNNEVKVVKKSTKATKQTGTKILVRNIPFQANQKEIRELFSVFGEIKALRLPKKMALDGGSHRGFAFVDFVAASDAKNAFEALCQSTHLYGRRLVLEWASSEDSVDDIRKRTAAHFQTTEAVKSKKSVLSID
ncbi:probable RNA-binding protein 19 [Tribolium castaneum]|nr:PREDICTED: probable RNA-binding protein 19 [Tribolium castaneum]|eukprot:XP_001807432.1 PREDICTED: probable RNA-binding protein 19 [Tribolium castaneum]